MATFVIISIVLHLLTFILYTFIGGKFILHNFVVIMSCFTSICNYFTAVLFTLVCVVHPVVMFCSLVLILLPFVVFCRSLDVVLNLCVYFACLCGIFSSFCSYFGCFIVCLCYCFPSFCSCFVPATTHFASFFGFLEDVLNYILVFLPLCSCFASLHSTLAFLCALFTSVCINF